MVLDKNAPRYIYFWEKQDWNKLRTVCERTCDVCACACVCVCVRPCVTPCVYCMCVLYVCVCVWERERERVYIYLICCTIYRWMCNLFNVLRANKTGIPLIQKHNNFRGQVPRKKQTICLLHHTHTHTTYTTHFLCTHTPPLTPPQQAASVIIRHWTLCVCVRKMPV